jgi:NitT/TauT family transport system substrate-binding protein
VRLVPTTGSGPAMPYLLHGSLDISFGNYVSFIATQASGAAQLRVLADGYAEVPGGFEILVPENSPIKTVADLKGKTIAVNALNNVGTLITRSELAANGIPPSSVHFVAIPFPLMGAALAAHRVDAGWFTEPFLTEAEEKYGAYAVLDTDSGATSGFPISGYVTTAAFAARYPKTAAAFARAIVKAQKMADQSRTLVEQVLPRFTGVPSEVAVTMVTGNFPTSVDPTRLQRVADLMLRFGMLKHHFDMITMTNASGL